MKNINGQFRIIAINTVTGSKMILPDIFPSYEKSCAFAEKMNAKHQTSSVVFIATRNLEGIPKRNVESLFQKAE